MSPLENQVALARTYRDDWSVTKDYIENVPIRCAKENIVGWFEKCVAAREDTGADLKAAWQYLLKRMRNTEHAMDWGLLETSLVCEICVLRRWHVCLLVSFGKHLEIILSVYCFALL